MIKLLSFGYKCGVRPSVATETIDCRRLANPHHERYLRDLTGQDEKVQAFVKNDPLFTFMRDKALTAAKDEAVIAFGCYGGRHRSVAMAEMVANELRIRGFDVDIEHYAL